MATAATAPAGATKIKAKMPKSKKKMLVFSGIVLLLLILAIAGPYIAPNDPYAAEFDLAKQGPSSEFPMGTDKLGRCLFSRILAGAGSTIFSALLLVLIIFIIGTLLGAIAGYVGGVTDMVIMRIVDIFLSFPDMVLALAVAGVLGSGMKNAIIAMAVIGWTKFARLARSQVLSIKEDVFVQSARLSGNSSLAVLFKHLLPNVAAPLVVTATLDIGSNMMNLAGLSFLGLGAQPPTIEWGYMMSEGRSLLQVCPWLVMFPGVAIFIAVVVFNLFGDAVRDVLDPRQSR